MDITQQFFRDEEKYFEGYEVPQKIKNVAKIICFRFVITGLCDPMYISNVIARKSGSGNGEGYFTSDSIANAQVIADHLQHAYGCNIERSEINELKEIIETGQLEVDMAIKGMKAYLKKLRAELAICEEWRKFYVSRLITQLQLNMEELMHQKEGRGA